MTAIPHFILLLIFTSIELNLGRPGVIYRELLPSVNENFTMTSHLEYTHIKKVCSSRYSICKSNNTKVCAMRHFHNQVQYEDFENSCFMFLRNMCDNPGEEYYIISSGTCKDFLRNRRKQTKSRRDEADEEADEEPIADQDEEDTNAEQEIETNPEETEHDDENYTENPEEDNTELQQNIEADKDEADNNEANTENQEQESIEEQVENDMSESPENQEEQHSENAEPNESDEEIQSNNNDEEATEPTEEESSDGITESVSAYIETTGHIETHITIPMSRTKHPKAAISKESKGSKSTPTKGKQNKRKATKSNTKKAKEKEIIADHKTDVTTPLSKVKYSKAALRQQKSNKKSTKPNNQATTAKKNAAKKTAAPAKKATTKKAATPAKKATTKKAATPAKKATTKKAATPAKKATTKKAATPANKATTKKAATPAKKQGTTRLKLYPVDEAFDDHPCPLSCPTTYSPVCVSANRGSGVYFKFYTFINHCFGDIYYCKHPDEFKPPPDEDEENVIASPLSWSFCAASRYIQFARFTEVASSMGHYGWLAGDYRPTHIMEPHERIVGYG